MFQSTITKEEIRQLPRKTFEGMITVIDNIPSFEKYFPVIQKEKLWGFDTETRPTFRKGIMNKPAMVQFANRTHAFLFRLNRIGLPDRMADIIADPGIIKVGVALHDDLNDLAMHREIVPDGFIDLQKYATKFGIESKGLTKLTAIVLNFRISKSQQTSNWENNLLSQAQLVYAATDAWVCYEIYKRLRSFES
ncbi:MAG: hypothetical protein AMS27_05820 [Bacteroides sp. SM23_62_1]|nr:MAG: hypothetical protein AMS27_05820 [Bacteroides sp. SM23_62_1]